MASKNMTNENFPVAKLVKKSLRPIVIAYYKAARLADDIADDEHLQAAEKLALLQEIETDFYAGLQQKSQPHQQDFAYELGQIFAAEQLDASLYTDLLKAFAKDAKGIEIEVWEQLIDYCRFSAAPVGRFILALYDESPTTYLPAETLCAVLQISNHLQDLKSDAISLKRCYLPLDVLDKFGAHLSDVYLDKTYPPLQQAIIFINQKLKQMLADSLVLLSVTRSKRLKIQLGIIHSLTNSMLKKIDNNDVLVKKIRLNFYDYLKALLVGSCKGLFAKHRNTGSVL